MTEYETEISDELTKEIEEMGAQYFMDGYEGWEVVQYLESDFPTVDPELLETIVSDTESSLLYDADRSFALMEFGGGDGIWGPTGNTLGLLEDGKDFRIIHFELPGLNVSDLFRCTKKQFKKLSKEQTSAFILGYLTSLTNLDGCFAEGVYRIDLDYVREEDADPLFAAMKAKKDGDGEYSLRKEFTPNDAFYEKSAELDARILALPLKNLLIVPDV